MNRQIRFFIILIELLFFTTKASAQSEKYLSLSDSASNFLKMERWTDAERVIVEALKLEPGNFTNSLLLSNLGVAHTNMNQYDKALEDFRLSLSIAPRSTVARNNRSRTLMLAKRYSEALQDLTESLEIDSTQIWPRQMRGFLLLQAGDPEGAYTDFMNLYKTRPENHSVLSGLALASEAREKNDEAIRYFDMAIKCEDVPETRFSRILLKIKMEQFMEAADDIRESLEKYPHYADFYVARARLNRLTYRYADAELDKKIALEKGADPQFVEQYVPQTRR